MIFDLNHRRHCSMIFYRTAHRTHLFQEERNIAEVAVGLPVVKVIFLPVSDQGEAAAVLRARRGAAAARSSGQGEARVRSSWQREAAVSSW